MATKKSNTGTVTTARQSIGPGGRLVMENRPHIKRYIVLDDSMNCGSRKSVPQGWIANVDLHRKPRTGDLVIAEKMDGSFGTFRQLARVRRRWILRALNTRCDERELDLKREIM